MYNETTFGGLANLPADYVFKTPSTDIYNAEYNPFQTLCLSGSSQAVGNNGFIKSTVAMFASDDGTWAISSGQYGYARNANGEWVKDCYTYGAVSTLMVRAVPEPTTWAMMLLGLVGLGWVGIDRTAQATKGLIWRRLTVQQQIDFAHTAQIHQTWQRNRQGKHQAATYFCGQNMRQCGVRRLDQTSARYTLPKQVKQSTLTAP